ncbi:MAG: hypothetical protein A3H97_02235 [Acidobacteria bacterium RIFCSPLOWO2_02_FULL_65_29]|nr:MAG: hypothetical protein A3H97_02235 [Acidobacteria bacterium RIFCSPLOWO2_02_FULL_65_29]
MAVVLAVGLAGVVHAQQVTKKTLPGVTNFATVETTVACAGAVDVSAIPDIKNLGFKSIINLRQASEQGANIEGSTAAAKAAGIPYVHIPFNTQSPSPNLVPDFLAAVTNPANQPAFIHCAGGGRAASMWMIKRLKVDGWDQQKAVDEATALGLANERLKTFALDWVNAHK